MTATVFKNARMVLPGEVVLGSLQVDGGRIASLDSGGTAALQGIDLGATTCCRAWSKSTPTTSSAT